MIKKNKLFIVLEILLFTFPAIQIGLIIGIVALQFTMIVLMNNKLITFNL
jgi:hypothetical protein